MERQSKTPTDQRREAAPGIKTGPPANPQQVDRGDIERGREKLDRIVGN